MPSAPLVLVTTTSDIPTSTASNGPAACDIASSRVWVNRAYTDALAANGLIPAILPPMRASAAIAALQDVAGLVLTGGEDIDPRHFGEDPHAATGIAHAMRDEYEISLVRAARERRIPTLAICRGAQIVNVALGGSLIQDISAQHPRGRERVHAVELAPDSWLASIVGETRIAVNGYHHQAIGRVAPDLRVVGRSPDGIVEAIESTAGDWWMVGVQWHAEDLTATDEDWDRRIFAAFADEVAAAIHRAAMLPSCGD
jgi:putative glutamine amidotransferase